MTTILVSGASGVIGYGILRSLRAAEGYKLIGTTVYDDSIAPAFCDVFEQAPHSDDEQYLDWLDGVIAKHHVDVIIPGIEIDMRVWNDARDRLSQSGATLVLNNPELVVLCSDKWNFYEKLHAAQSDYVIESSLVPSFEQLSADFGVPFLLKPRRGSASKGIVIVDNAQTFQRYESEVGSVLLAQPIIGTNEEEYTVSAFFDHDSKLCCYMSLRRKLSKEGFTEKAETVEPEGVSMALEKLAELLHPIGPTNFQFRLHQGRLKLLEINPRISSATSIRTAFGYNESSMSVEYFLQGKRPAQPLAKKGYAVRYTEDYIFYDSATV